MLEEKILTVNNDEYLFITGYRDDTNYRQGLNELTRKTYGFDFEQWYQLGYWSDRYLPHSLVHKGKLVANVSVNTIDFLVDGKLYPTLQIGTVMTDLEYRHKGLSRALMETILDKYKDKAQLIYLYVNDSVLDFYPKFGFTKADEYVYSGLIRKDMNSLKMRKLDMKTASDLQLINRLVTKNY